MYIKQIELLNFQRIEKFSGNFEGNVYLVTGENELGKSTLLKAIMVLLTGNRDEVLRNGAEKGFAKIVVGGDGKEYEVELRMTANNPRGNITIKSKDTGLRSDRITALQDIFGYQDFDANEFVSWSETAEGRRKQVQIVKSLLPETVQKRIAEIDSRVAGLKTERTEINRELKAYTTIAKEAGKGITDADIETYAEPQDITSLLNRQQSIMQLITRGNEAKRRHTEIIEQLQAIPGKREQQKSIYDDEIDEIEINIESAKNIYKRMLEDAKKQFDKQMAELAEAKKEANAKYDNAIAALDNEEKDLSERKEKAEKWLKNYEEVNPESQDVTAQLKEAEEHNKMHARVTDYLSKKEKAEAKQKEVNVMEKEINQLQQERESIVSSASLPITGLNFTDDGLELNGIPFVAGKVSDSQIMEVAAKLIIAKNPKVKVFRIARGESLGQKKLEALIGFAKANGYQGFIEQVVREQNELRVEEYTEK